MLYAITRQERMIATLAIMPLLLLMTATLVVSSPAAPNAYAATSSVTGTGSYAATAFEPCFGWNFDLNVSGKQSGVGDATGTFKLVCAGEGGESGDSSTASIDTIVSITDTTAHVRGKLTLTQFGVKNCVDQDGKPVSHVLTNVQVQEGTSTSTPQGTIRVFAEYPPGVTSITCENDDDPTTLPGETSTFLPTDTGVEPITEGSITVTV